jgi:hypothetical protein
MLMAFPARKVPARNALTVAVTCVNPTRKPVVDVARSSARPAFSFIERSTRSPPQRITEKTENEKPPKPRTSFYFPITAAIPTITKITSSKPTTTRRISLRESGFINSSLRIGITSSLAFRA